jgi:hypothetical protein
MSPKTARVFPDPVQEFHMKTLITALALVSSVAASVLPGAAEAVSRSMTESMVAAKALNDNAVQPAQQTTTKKTRGQKSGTKSSGAPAAAAPAAGTVPASPPARGHAQAQAPAPAPASNGADVDVLMTPDQMLGIGKGIQ